jgi:hypothetical protein
VAGHFQVGRSDDGLRFRGKPSSLAVTAARRLEKIWISKKNGHEDADVDTRGPSSL